MSVKHPLESPTEAALAAESPCGPRNDIAWGWPRSCPTHLLALHSSRLKLELATCAQTHIWACGWQGCDPSMNLGSSWWPGLPLLNPCSMTEHGGVPVRLVGLAPANRPHLYQCVSRVDGARILPNRGVMSCRWQRLCRWGQGCSFPDLPCPFVSLALTPLYIAHSVITCGSPMPTAWHRWRYKAGV